MHQKTSGGLATRDSLGKDTLTGSISPTVIDALTLLISDYSDCIVLGDSFDPSGVSMCVVAGGGGRGQVAWRAMGAESVRRQRSVRFRGSCSLSSSLVRTIGTKVHAIVIFI